MPAEHKKRQVRAFQLEAGHFTGEKAAPEWMKGRAELIEWSGTCGKLHDLRSDGYWLVNASDWVIFLDPGFMVTNARLFHEFYEAM